jgi:hypothetical protein
MKETRNGILSKRFLASSTPGFLRNPRSPFPSGNSFHCRDSNQSLSLTKRYFVIHQHFNR